MCVKIFIGGLDPNVTNDDLKQLLSQHGDIVSVNLPVGKGCGFIQFANRKNALHKLNGTVISKQTMHLEDVVRQISSEAYYEDKCMANMDMLRRYLMIHQPCVQQQGTHQQQVN
ncbi:unnamed protein product [Citrullus colocynthis]|uniref:RRM domain-containing protein n=1 Tax=Citrullus colocynthis TaxID=252529 RepID=A0ABP0XWR0_9ROSI